MGHHSPLVFDGIMYTSNALRKLRKYGLHHYHIREALKYGVLVTPFIQGFQQTHYRYKGEKDIDVLFTTTTKDQKPLNAIKVVSCWVQAVT
jgi:hypothetical protein